MPSRSRRYNNIHDALRSRIINFISNKGLTCANTSEHYGYPYETIKSIARAFKEIGQLVLNHRGSIRYPILQDEHIQWLVERFDVDPNITMEFIHCS